MNDRYNQDSSPSFSDWSYLQLHKVVAGVVCFLFVILSSLTLFGCGDDYQDFLEKQARYEAEKELVNLLRSYNDVYTKNKSVLSTHADTVLEFIFESETVLTVDCIKSVSLSNNVLTIVLNEAGADVFYNITSLAENYGKQIEIVSLLNDISTVVVSAFIGQPVLGGVLAITGNSMQSAYDFVLAKYTECKLKQTALSYNEKRESCDSTAEYLPQSIPLPPQLFDASAHLEKAAENGF